MNFIYTSYNKLFLLIQTLFEEHISINIEQYSQTNKIFKQKYDKIYDTD